MTRARARAFEVKVTYFLSDISYDPLETWLLPKSGMLCMIGYQEGPLEDAREDGQVPKHMDEEERQEEPNEVPRNQTSGPWPGHLAPDGYNHSSKTAAAKLHDPDIRPLHPEIQPLITECNRRQPSPSETSG